MRNLPNRPCKLHWISACSAPFEHRGDQSLYRQNAWQSASESKNSYSLCLRRDSASPMETCLALLLGLPGPLWRLRLGMPEMNAKVLIPARLGKRTTYRKYHCDLYWSEQNVAIEYNSREFHVNELAVERDASRINNLKAAGIEALAVTRAHVADNVKFDAIAHSAASLMGKRIRIAYVDIDERRMSLRKQLFSKDPWC